MSLTAIGTSCRGGRHGLLPTSGGRPYEVLVVNDVEGIVADALSKYVEGLPQPEPSFDVSSIDEAHFNQSVWNARSIVKVDVDPDKYAVTRIKYEKNTYAEPQMIVKVNTPSLAVLKRDIRYIAPMLRNLLLRAEMNAEISRLRVCHNAKAENVVRKMFGWSISVPPDMLSSKKGNNFIWLSNNSATGMQNLCIYFLPIRRLTRAGLIAARDSVMKCNMAGGMSGMYMRTVPSSVTVGKTIENGSSLVIMRGLWDMKGDAMGGPFVAHMVTDTLKRRIIVAEAFVYAPEMNKRNKLRQTEAALYTLLKY